MSKVPKKRAEGRPTALTKDVISKVVLAIENGLFIDQACLMSEISRDTYYDWMRKAKDQPDSYPECVEFSDMVKKAQVQFENSMVGIILGKARAGEWTAAAWILERKFPYRWGKKERIEIAGPQGGDTTNIMIVLPDNGMRVAAPIAIEQSPKPNKKHGPK